MLKISTHVKILRFITGMPEDKLRIYYVPEGEYNEMLDGNEGVYDAENNDIYVLDDDNVLSYLAHEFRHAVQFKSWDTSTRYRNDIIRHDNNLKKIAEKRTFWRTRKYYCNILEIEARWFAIAYLFFTCEGYGFFKSLRYEFIIFFKYVLMLNPLYMAYYKVKDMVQN